MTEVFSFDIILLCLWFGVVGVFTIFLFHLIERQEFSVFANRDVRLPWFTSGCLGIIGFAGIALSSAPNPLVAFFSITFGALAWVTLGLMLPRWNNSWRGYWRWVINWLFVALVLWWPLPGFRAFGLSLVVLIGALGTLSILSRLRFLPTTVVLLSLTVLGVVDFFRVHRFTTLTAEAKALTLWVGSVGVGIGDMLILIFGMFVLYRDHGVKAAWVYCIAAMFLLWISFSIPAARFPFVTWLVPALLIIYFSAIPDNRQNPAR